MFNPKEPGTPRRLTLLIDLDKTLLLNRADWQANDAAGKNVTAADKQWITDFKADGRPVMLRSGTSTLLLHMSHHRDEPLIGVGNFLADVSQSYDIWIVTAGAPTYAHDCIKQANHIGWLPEREIKVTDASKFPAALPSSPPLSKYSIFSFFHSNHPNQ
jgi:hypothetical protein